MDDFLKDNLDSLKLDIEERKPKVEQELKDMRAFDLWKKQWSNVTGYSIQDNEAGCDDLESRFRELGCYLANSCYVSWIDDIALDAIEADNRHLETACKLISLAMDSETEGEIAGYVREFQTATKTGWTMRLEKDGVEELERAMRKLRISEVIPALPPNLTTIKQVGDALDGWNNLSSQTIRKRRGDIVENNKRFRFRDNDIQLSALQFLRNKPELDRLENETTKIADNPDFSQRSW